MGTVSDMARFAASAAAHCALALLLSCALVLNPFCEARRAEAFAPVAAAALPYAGYALCALAGIVGINVAAENAGSMGRAWQKFVSDYDSMMWNAADCAAQFLTGMAADGADIISENVEVTQESVQQLTEWLEECAKSGIMDANRLAAVNELGALSPWYFILQAFFLDMTSVYTPPATTAVGQSLTAQGFKKMSASSYSSADLYNLGDYYQKTFTLSGVSSSYGLMGVSGNPSSVTFTYRFLDAEACTSSHSFFKRLLQPVYTNVWEEDNDYNEYQCIAVPVAIRPPYQNEYSTEHELLFAMISPAAAYDSGLDYSKCLDFDYLVRTYLHVNLLPSSAINSSGSWDKMNFVSFQNSGNSGITFLWTTVYDYIMAVSDDGVLDRSALTCTSIQSHLVVADQCASKSAMLSPYVRYTVSPAISAALRPAFFSWDGLAFPKDLTDNPDVLPNRDVWGDARTRVDYLNPAAGAAVIGSGAAIDGDYIKSRGTIGFPPIPLDSNGEADSRSNPLSGAGSQADSHARTGSGVAEHAWGKDIPTDRTVETARTDAETGEAEKVTDTVSEAVRPSDPARPPTAITVPVVPDPTPWERVTGDVSGKFPFCLPGDLGRLLGTFSREPEAPSFTWSFWSPEGAVEYEVDLSRFDQVASVCRMGMLVSLLCGLVFVAVRLINMLRSAAK